MRWGSRLTAPSPPMIDWITSLLFPEKCINCGLWGKYVCQKCQVGMWEAEPLRALDGMTCLWSYEGLVQKLIKRAKYKRQYDLLKFLISNFKFQIKPEFSGFVVVPVPLHKNRLRERGFNQSMVIAEVVARSWMLDLREILIRVKDTGHQVGRNRQERLAALKDAFAISPKIQDLPSKILLVDDVWTTGTTMRECYKVLKKAGVKKVYGFVLAR